MGNASSAIKIGAWTTTAILAAILVWTVSTKDRTPSWAEYQTIAENGSVTGSGFIEVAQGEVVAYLNYAEGEVVKNGGSASVGDSVRVGEIVSVGGDSNAEIVFIDSSVMRLSANTAISIKSSVSNGTEAELLSWEIWSRILKPLTEGSFFSIITSDLSVGVRGTSVRIAKTSDATDVEVFDSTGNGAETPGVDITYLDADGIEMRERIEPENGIALNSKKREVKKRKIPITEAMKRSFVRENTLKDLAYMLRLLELAEEKQVANGIVTPLISEIEGRLDKKSLNELRSRLEKEISATLPKHEEIPVYYSESSIRERVLKNIEGLGESEIHKILLQESEREAFLVFQDQKIAQIRREIQNQPSDAELREKIAKRVEDLRAERQRRIEEWKKERFEILSESGAVIQSGVLSESGALLEMGAIIQTGTLSENGTTPQKIESTPLPPETPTPTPKPAVSSEPVIR